MRGAWGSLFRLPVHAGVVYRTWRMRRTFQTVLAGILSLAAAVGTRAADVVADVDVGSSNEAAAFGFGWWRAETDRQTGRTFRWIRFHLEADCWLTPADTGADEIEVSAAPYYHPRRAQSLALYINDRFVGEWRFPLCRNWIFRPLRAAIPAGVLRKGRNRIVLRAGYTGDHGYAVAVERIRLLKSDAKPRRLEGKVRKLQSSYKLQVASCRFAASAAERLEIRYKEIRAANPRQSSPPFQYSFIPTSLSPPRPSCPLW